MEPPVGTPVSQLRKDRRGAVVPKSWPVHAHAAGAMWWQPEKDSKATEGSIGREVCERPGRGCKPGTVAGQAITSGISYGCSQATKGCCEHCW